jgi:hypothetical protein
MFERPFHSCRRRAALLVSSPICHGPICHSNTVARGTEANLVALAECVSDATYNIIPGKVVGSGCVSDLGDITDRNGDRILSAGTDRRSNVRCFNDR